MPPAAPDPATLARLRQLVNLRQFPLLYPLTEANLAAHDRSNRHEYRRRTTGSAGSARSSASCTCSYCQPQLLESTQSRSARLQTLIRTRASQSDTSHSGWTEATAGSDYRSSSSLDGTLHTSNYSRAGQNEESGPSSSSVNKSTKLIESHSDYKARKALEDYAKQRRVLLPDNMVRAGLGVNASDLRTSSSSRDRQNSATNGSVQTALNTAVRDRSTTSSRGQQQYRLSSDISPPYRTSGPLAPAHRANISNPRSRRRPRSGRHRRTQSISSQDSVTTVTPDTPSTASANASANTSPSPAPDTPPPSYDECMSEDHARAVVHAIAHSIIEIDTNPSAPRANGRANRVAPWADLRELPDLPRSDNLREHVKNQPLRSRRP